MRRLFAAMALFMALPVCAQINPLQQAVAEGAKSVAWKIHTRGVSTCCCDGEGWTVGAARVEHTEIVLLAEIAEGRVETLRMREPDCPVKADRFVTATADQSLDFLLAQMRSGTDENHIVAAVAMHDDPRTVPALIDLARHHHSTRARRQAIFWLGQRAGEKAAGELRRIVDEDPDDDIRKQAVFAIAQLPKERSVPMLIELAKTHKRPAVRKRAMFWLAQSGDPRALDFIEEVLGTR